MILRRSEIDGRGLLCGFGKAFGEDGREFGGRDYLVEWKFDTIGRCVDNCIVLQIRYLGP